MSMDLRLLRYFTATVDAGSATRAAAQLHVTQPVLSRQLRQFERRIGVDLFTRRAARLVLTPAGTEFLPVARDLLRRAEEAERMVETIAAGRLERLRLAVPTTTLTDVVAPFLATLGPDDPVPDVRELDPRGAEAAVAAGADVAVVTRAPSAALATQPLAVLPVWAYVRADDQWADQAEVTLAELVDRPLVVLTPDFRPRQLLDEALEAEGARYRELIECANAQVAQAHAAAGRGVAVVSDDPRFDLVPLGVTSPAGPLVIRLYAAWDPHHHSADLLGQLARRLSDFIADRYGSELRPPSSLAAPSGWRDHPVSKHES